MSAYVIDSSAALRFDHQHPDNATYFAPELIDIEFTNALRKLVLRGQATPAEADRTITDWARSPVVRTSHSPLVPRVWQMRHNITPYDATYVALAESMGVPLITADRRLAATAARYCEVVALP